MRIALSILLAIACFFLNACASAVVEISSRDVCDQLRLERYKLIEKNADDLQQSMRDIHSGLAGGLSGRGFSEIQNHEAIAYASRLHSYWERKNQEEHKSIRQIETIMNRYSCIFEKN